MKVIVNGMRYSTAKAQMIFRIQEDTFHIEVLWKTKKGSWLHEIVAPGIDDKLKTVVFLLSPEEALETLESFQFASPGAYSPDTDPQSVVEIIERHFSDKIKDE